MIVFREMLSKTAHITLSARSAIVARMTVRQTWVSGQRHTSQKQIFYADFFQYKIFNSL